MNKILISIVGLLTMSTAGTIIVKKEVNKSEYSNYIKGLGRGNDNGYVYGFSEGYKSGKAECETNFSVLNIPFAENIDTVYVRNLTLKYEEWSWVIGGLNPLNMDSVYKKKFKKLSKFLDDANPAGFATNITYDSLPGRFALFMFSEYWSHTEARENMGTGIDTKLRAYTPLASFIAQMDAARLAAFINRRNLGRDIIE